MRIGPNYTRQKRTWIIMWNKADICAVLLSNETSTAPFPRHLQNVADISRTKGHLYVQEKNAGLNRIPSKKIDKKCHPRNQRYAYKIRGFQHWRCRLVYLRSLIMKGQLSYLMYLLYFFACTKVTFNLRTVYARSTVATILTSNLNRFLLGPSSLTRLF